jgi:hypothetical protein
VQVIASEYGISEPSVRFARSSGAFLARNQAMAAAIAAGADPLAVAGYFDLTEKSVKLLVLDLDNRVTARHARKVLAIVGKRVA